MARTLDVYLNTDLVGRLTPHDDGDMSFQCAESVRGRRQGPFPYPIHCRCGPSASAAKSAVASSRHPTKRETIARNLGIRLQVQEDVNIFDNYQGDYSKSEWRYTIHNISYTPPRVIEPYIGVGGLSGMYLPFGPLYFSPTTNPVTSLSGFTYSLTCAPNNDPSCVFGWNPGPVGILVGQSIDLSLLMANPVYITQRQAHIFSTAAGFGKYLNIYDMTAEIEPGTPEPATTALVGAGVIAVAVALRRRKHGL